VQQSPFTGQVIQEGFQTALFARLPPETPLEFRVLSAGLWGAICGWPDGFQGPWRKASNDFREQASGRLRVAATLLSSALVDNLSSHDGS